MNWNICEGWSVLLTSSGGHTNYNNWTQTHGTGEDTQHMTWLNNSVLSAADLWGAVSLCQSDRCSAAAASSSQTYHRITDGVISSQCESVCVIQSLISTGPLELTVPVWHVSKITWQIYERVFFTAPLLQIKHPQYLSVLSASYFQVPHDTPLIETPAFLSCHCCDGSHTQATWN